MLKLWYGDLDYLQYKGFLPKSTESIIQTPATWFDTAYEVDWLNKDISKEIIKEIDNSQHIKDHLIESPILGAITPSMLSGGAKVLITMINNPNLVVRMNSCGDNCMSTIGKLSKLYDMQGYVEYVPDYINVKELDIMFMTTGKRYSNGKVFYLDYIRYDIEYYEDYKKWKETQGIELCF